MLLLYPGFLNHVHDFPFLCFFQRFFLGRPDGTTVAHIRRQEGGEKSIIGVMMRRRAEECVLCVIGWLEEESMQAWEELEEGAGGQGAPVADVDL
jgi:hypothetical protein